MTRPDDRVRALRIEPLDLTAPRDAAALVALLDEYARDPTGGGTPLADDAKARLPGLLASRAHYAGLLAWDGDRPVGLVNAFEGVSTFKARPLLNIHDIAVAASHRGRGVGRALLAAAESLARARGCCKLTLEALEGNATAIGLYRSVGFVAYELDPAMGRATFFEKWLT
ncbi:MAG: GNAT family N-acetyltransferase [Burkholderiaceae bacterium]|jgi:ribosomal protein S18 acetylase RimI-like enzyme|nr:GNAT family N-acetyltransferase [Burkholderiales bacterium]MCZ8098056.1 GNAT family N-acetyltransferase [Burkholderiales bacterium]MCZ8336732.1 GNAT family N-acetyltransferase [Burkholderiaceae bacterium]